MRQLLLGALGALSLSATTASAADLKVTFTGLKTESAHQIHMFLWNNSDDFLEEDRAFQTRVLDVSAATQATSFQNLPDGSYALMAFHDEDGDGEMDRFLGMIPTEGFALSRNPSPMGKPAFEESEFDLSGPHTEIVLQMKY